METAAAPPPIAAWPDSLHIDYHAAAIRLVTLTESGVQHLLFANVELYPHEIPLPPSNVERLKRNFGDTTLSITIAVMSVADALAWYEGAIAGNLMVPGLTREVPVRTVRLSPEPALGRLLISDELPFSVRWHAGPRVHRLVPLDDFPESINQLSSGEKDERQIKIREWLADGLGFDLLAYDDVLCGLALLAPNPVVRGVATFIKETRSDGSERLGVKAALRRGILGNTLRVQFREERPGGLAVLEKRLDPFGMAEFDLPERCERSALQLICDERGVLTIEAAAHFLRGFSVTSHSMESQGHIEIPPRRKSEPAITYPLPPLRPEPPPSRPSALSGALRLEDLQIRRRGRSGHRRPDGFVQLVEDDDRIFINDRLDAISFIQRLVRRAHQRVIFVDPYFDHIDVARFALGTQYEGVSVSVLTGNGDRLYREIDDPEGGSVLAGDVFVTQLSKLDAELHALKRRLPEVRLMGEEARVYHDRFLVIDDLVWHFGHSFNQIGEGEVSMVTRVRQADELRKLICEDVDRAELFIPIWPALKARRPQKKKTARTWHDVWQSLKNAVISCLGRRPR